MDSENRAELSLEVCDFFADRSLPSLLSEVSSSTATTPAGGTPRRSSRKKKQPTPKASLDRAFVTALNRYETYDAFRAGMIEAMQAAYGAHKPIQVQGPESVAESTAAVARMIGETRGVSREPQGDSEIDPLVRAATAESDKTQGPEQPADNTSFPHTPAQKRPGSVKSLDSVTRDEESPSFLRQPQASSQKAGSTPPKGTDRAVEPQASNCATPAQAVKTSPSGLCVSRAASQPPGSTPLNMRISTGEETFQDDRLNQTLQVSLPDDSFEIDDDAPPDAPKPPPVPKPFLRRRSVAVAIGKKPDWSTVQPRTQCRPTPRTTAKPRAARRVQDTQPASGSDATGDDADETALVEAAGPVRPARMAKMELESLGVGGLEVGNENAANNGAMRGKGVKGGEGKAKRPPRNSMGPSKLQTPRVSRRALA